MFRKIALLSAATAISTMSVVPSIAATNEILPTPPATEIALNGNGASSVANVVVQELNCFGGTNNPLGLTTPGTKPIADHAYHPTKPSSGNPDYDCATMSVQDKVNGHYVSTGSGGGKTSWSKLNTSGISANPFTYGSNIQFAFSDSPVNSTVLSDYNTFAAPTAGAPIQIPMFVLPVAIAYSPVYGKLKTATGVTPLSFHLKYPRADGTGGLRLKMSTLCGIMTGAITNWNNAALQADNGGQSLMDPSDNASRWATTGVPIKLVGRSDNSGTTDILTRALASWCGTTRTAGDSPFGNSGAEQLPTSLKGTAVYNKTDGSVSSGTETAGLFGLVNGSDGVAVTVDRAPDEPTTIGQVTLNGRFGYVGADWVRPSTLSGSGLHSADLQQGGTGTKFLAPTATNATAAFKNILPPQGNAKGQYDPAYVPTTAQTQLPGLRTSATSWVFPATITLGSGANKLAAPVAGYPITGTTNMLLYTCYADPAVRNAMDQFALYHLGKVTTPDNTTDGAPAKVPAKLVSNTAKGTDGLQLGILPKNGIAPLPAAFATAIIETFFTNVTTGNKPGDLKLWIQDKQQKKSTDVTSANPLCTAGAGA